MADEAKKNLTVITIQDDEEEEEKASPTGLESISNEFKGILMDLHSSMMTEESTIGDELDRDLEATFGSKMTTTAELSNDSDSKMNTAEQEQVVEQDVEMIEDLNKTKEMPTMKINIDLQQITGCGDDNYTSFGGGSEEIKTATENVDFVDGAAPPEAEQVVENKLPPLSKIKLYVSNLPTGFSSEDMNNLFEPFGTVIECELFSYKNFANVYLDNEAGGFEAIKELNKVKINGSQILVMKSTLGTGKKAAVNSGSYEEIGSFKIYINYMFNGVTKEFVQKMVEEYGRVVEIEIYRLNSAFVHMEEEAAGRRMIEELNGKVLPECDRPIQVSESKNPEGPSISTVKLQIKNFPEELTADQVRSLVQPYGLVIKCTVSGSKFDLLRKAVVHLEQLGDIRSAIKELNELELNGKKLIVEPVVEKHEKQFGGPQFKKSKNIGPLLRSPLPPLQIKPEYYDEYSGYNEEYSFPNPLHVSSRGMHHQRGGLSRGRGAGPKSLGGGRLIPMPSMLEIQHFSRGRGRAMRPSFIHRGRGRPQNEGVVSRYPKRAYNSKEFVEDYSFDEYYEEPAAVSARDHYATLQAEYDQFSQSFQNPQQAQFGYSPPKKRSRGRGGMGGPRGGGRALPSLMPEDFNPYAEDTPDYEMPTAYQSHHSQQSFQSQSLNLPLGEREYGKNKGNFGAPNIKKRNNQQLQQQVQSFQHQQSTIASGSGYPNYLVPEQIPSSSNNSANGSQVFEYDTAYPAEYYTGASNFSAIPFDYSSLKQKQKSNRVHNGTPQTTFPPGVKPSDFPNLKPGSRVYVNQAGKVMVRGNRGGQQNNKKKGKRPGLGSGLSLDTQELYVPSQNHVTVPAGPPSFRYYSTPSNTSVVSGANQIPVGSANMAGFGGYTGYNNAGFGTGFNNGMPKNNKFSNFNNKMGGAQKKYKTKQEVKDDNQVYTDWLQSKAWLTQTIPGVVRPAT